MSAEGGTGDVRTYAYVTAAYWADTITDGAIRVLVLFYFYQLGYSPLQVASLFIFYEVFGVITNLFGGWIAARWGLKSTLVGGLSLQIGALLMLALAPTAWLVDTTASQKLLGAPGVSLTTMIDWVADWVARGGESLGKPTHFEARDGRY